MQLVVNHLFSVVLSTRFANMVWFGKLTAILTFVHFRCVKLFMSTTLILYLFGRSALRYCHVLHLLFIYDSKTSWLSYSSSFSSNNDCSLAIRGSTFVSSGSSVRTCQPFPSWGAASCASLSLEKTLVGISNCTFSLI